MPALTSVSGILLHYGYWLLFALTIFEGPIISVIAAFLASQGQMSLWIIYPIALCGDILGDFLYYAAGRWNFNFVKKYGPYIGITEARVKHAEYYFTNHHHKSLVLSKVVHGIGAAGLVAAGVVKVPYWKYFRTCTSVSVVQYGIFITLGYFLGQAYLKIDKYLNTFGLIVSAVAVLALIWYFIYKRGNEA